MKDELIKDRLFIERVAQVLDDDSLYISVIINVIPKIKENTKEFIAQPYELVMVPWIIRLN